MFRISKILGWTQHAAVSRGPAPAAYGEALLAGWIAPPPEIRTPPLIAARLTEVNADGTDFLARYYLNQRC